MLAEVTLILEVHLEAELVLTLEQARPKST